MKKGDLFMWYKEGCTTKEMLFISDLVVIDTDNGDRYFQSDIMDYEVDFDNVRNIFE